VSYQVFARKYRPKTFQDVLGQDHVIQTLRNAIEQDRLAHAYLFVGPRGTGKTSTARIMAKALNCSNGPSIEFDPEESICQEIAEGRSLDVLEIDGASNNGVEQVRDLRDNVRFAPTSCRYKIYYIDEVHMLTTAAFNALLKTLEEPPEHVKFIFATTEPHKILPTIISRCQRFDLRPIDTKTIADHLTYIAENEGVKLDPSAAWAIAKGADGGMRDAQSMLDQLVAFCGEHIAEENVLEVFGFTSRETIANLTNAILTKGTAEALEILHGQADTGKDLGQFLNDAIGCLRALLVSKVDPNADNDGIPADLWDKLTVSSETIKTDRLLNLVEIFAQTESNMKWASNKRLHMEIGIIKAIQSLNDVRISDIITSLAGAGALDEIPRPAPEVAAAPVVPAAEKKTIVEPVPAQTPAPAEPEAIVEPQVQPPVEPAPEPQVKLRQKETKSSEPFGSLDKFIESAPEESAAPAMPATEAAKPLQASGPSAAEKGAEAKELQEEKAQELAEDFNNDPLIDQALKTFEASRIN